MELRTSVILFQRYVIERMEKITILCEQNNTCTNRISQTMLTFFNPTLKIGSNKENLKRMN